MFDMSPILCISFVPCIFDQGDEQFVNIDSLLLRMAIINEHVDVCQVAWVQMQSSSEIEPVFCRPFFGNVIKTQSFFPTRRKNGTKSDVSTIITAILETRQGRQRWYANLWSTSFRKGDILVGDIFFAGFWKKLLPHNSCVREICKRLLNLAVVEIEFFLIAVEREPCVPESNIELLAYSFKFVVGNCSFTLVEFRSGTHSGDIPNYISDHRMILNGMTEGELSKDIDHRLEIAFQLDFHPTRHEPFRGGIHPNPLNLSTFRGLRYYHFHNDPVVTLIEESVEPSPVSVLEQLPTFRTFQLAHPRS